jgi:hypothetical protein
MYLSRFTAAFRRFKSTQSLTWPLFFKTGTIGIDYIDIHNFFEEV